MVFRRSQEHRALAPRCCGLILDPCNHVRQWSSYKAEIFIPFCAAFEYSISHLSVCPDVLVIIFRHEHTHMHSFAGASFCIRNHAGLRSPSLGRRYLPVSVLKPGSSKNECWHKNYFTDSHFFIYFFSSDLKPENVLLGTDVCIHTKPDMPYVRTIEANSG